MDIKPIQFYICHNHHKGIYALTVVDNDMPLWVDTYKSIKDLEEGIEQYIEDFDDGERGVRVEYSEEVKERIESEKKSKQKRDLIFLDGTVFQNASESKVVIENGEIGLETEDGEWIWAKLIGFSKEGHYICEHI